MDAPGGPGYRRGATERDEGMRDVWAWTMIGAMAAGSASAHAIIVDSMPAPLAHVPAGTLHVMLRYNSRIDAARSRLVLRHGDDSRRLTSDPADTPDVLRTALDVTPGEYEIVWQVLATDGHVTRGRVPFIVDAPASVAAGAAPNK